MRFIAKKKEYFYFYRYIGLSGETYIRSIVVFMRSIKIGTIPLLTHFLRQDTQKIPEEAVPPKTRQPPPVSCRVVTN